MNPLSHFDKRPIIVAIAGSNGAGKTTFYNAHLKSTGLRYVNPDILAAELDLEAYASARLATTLRQALVEKQESFIFETVFSDPIGDKLTFLKNATANGYTVVLCFIGLSGADLSEQRVAMRVSQNGHDVPTDKLTSRYPRTLANLARAIQELPHVLIFDNSDLNTPFKLTATTRHGQRVDPLRPVPAWLAPLLK